jgi:hypothetical protein
MKQKKRVLQQQVNCLNYFENTVGAFNMSTIDAHRGVRGEGV